MSRTYRSAIVAAFWLTPAIQASYLSNIPSVLYSRADIELACPVANTTACGSGLPRDFCCPNADTCEILASNTTALCCPSGATCTGVSPISCDIQRQNVTTYPMTPVMTTNLTATLVKCASECCPLGYLCAGNATCTIQLDQNYIPDPAASSTTSTSTLLTTSSASPSSTSTGYLIPEQTSTTTCSEHYNNFPATAVLVGLFPGILLGSILVLGTMCCLGRRRVRKVQRSDISGPVIVYGAPWSSNIDDAWATRAAKSSLHTGSSVTVTGSPAAGRQGKNAFVQRVTRFFNDARIPDDGFGKERGIELSSPATAYRNDESRGRNNATPPSSKTAMKAGQAFLKSSSHHAKNMTATNRGSGQSETVSTACGSRDVSPIDNREVPRWQQRESGEEINIFADAATVSPTVDAHRGWHQSRETTFSGLLHEARLPDVTKGGKFVQMSGEETLGSRKFSGGKF